MPTHWNPGPGCNLLELVSTKPDEWYELEEQHFTRYVYRLICQSIHLLACWFNVSRNILTLTLLCIQNIYPEYYLLRKFSFFTQTKTTIANALTYVWQNCFTCKISRKLKKKLRAARTKDGTVGLIIWHSKSYNKSYDYRIKISGQSCVGSYEALRNSNTTPPFYPARRTLL